MKNWYKFFLFLTLFFGVGHLCNKKTKGFSLYKIAPNSLTEAGPEAPPLAELDQPYFFLGRGGQSFAFVSADGKTVIKFFKHHQMYLLEWAKHLPLPSFLNPLREKILKKHRHRSWQLFDSCKIADTEFKKETGLIYLHLHKTTHFHHPLTLVDPLGISHQIDLNTTPFALQTRAEPAHATLKRLLKESKMEEARACIDSLIDLIAHRFEKQIADRDPNIRRNIGFVGCQAIEIDLGSYSKASQHTRSLQEELVQKTQKFHTWLLHNNPSLAAYLLERQFGITALEE
jgi:hypothetical protein